MQIEIAEIERRNVYRVWYEGEVIVASTTAPLALAARVLLDRGADPDETLEMVRRGKDQVDVRAKLGQLAERHVVDATDEEVAPTPRPSPNSDARRVAALRAASNEETADDYRGSDRRLGR
jgi:hypothetical protein